ncbi:hypothetical protein [Streptomyces beihaiensis]|uniref:Lipoprotein n=1 Tax=Streptomyces beihaiensis TaxID=2984495 RepID=A0ABT3TP81_9ACTN|nr:hypothetical protein [Streptomyces beihaiensis]MCX3058848.1 hypothetical protein [Streptomyces beihaiensis]
MRIRTLIPAALAAAALLLTGCKADNTAHPDAGATPSASRTSASTAPSPTPTPTASKATASPTPTVTVSLRSYAGEPVGDAVAAARHHGLTYSVRLADASATVTSPGAKASSYAKSEKVCRQLLDKDGLNPDFDVAFLIARDGHDCAGKPLPKPTPTHTSRPTSRTTSSTSTGSSGGSHTSCGPILSGSGNCYDAGQYCRKSDVGSSTRAANGRIIHCRYISTDSRMPHWQY